MALWLFKEEPTHYSFQDLQRDGRTVWSGVHNALALKHLRDVAKGDEIFYYHTGKEKAVVGVMQATKAAYPDPDPDEKDAKLVVVEVRPLRALPRPVTLREIKEDARFKDFALVRMSRLSVMPVTREQWRTIEAMSQEETSGN